MPVGGACRPIPEPKRTRQSEFCPMPILHWLNKDQAVTAAKRSAYRLLEEVPDLSYGYANNENLLIQGDNLEALKALIPFYAGKVKCIYIDPPFNTKQAFDHYDDNLEHSLWLSLMWPRLELLNTRFDTR
jgi:adenine-specific DNA-methyltransferase